MIADFLAEAAARAGDAAALTDGERRWSYRELDRWASELAEALADDGVRPGDVVPVIVDPDPEGIATLHAVARAGATVAPLHPKLTEAERQEALEVLSEADPAGAQAILWTSGSEGTPRGVALTADNLRASAHAVGERLGLGTEDRWLASLSVAHVGGFALVTRCALVGCDLLATGAPSTADIARALERGGVTHLSLVPTQLRRLLDARGGGPPAALRCVLIGGAHAPGPLVREAVEAGWPVALTYGKTETTSQVATASPAEVAGAPDRVGRPLDGVEVRIADGGEVSVRGPTVAAGYVGSGAALVDEDGWHRTGDLGAVDSDGALRITGRRSERVVSGGVTVDALEVEAVLRAHPAVVEACVVGVDDAEWGERVAALVVGVEGELDLEELADFVEDRLSPAKRPRLWRSVDRLPLNANGKVDRGAARAAFRDG